jgi:hypothetical protein
MAEEVGFESSIHSFAGYLKRWRENAMLMAVIGIVAVVTASVFGILEKTAGYQSEKVANVVM